MNPSNPPPHCIPSLQLFPFTTTTAKRVRKKNAKKACVNCSKSHQSCSDTRPCERCLKKGIECIEKQQQQTQEEPASKRKKTTHNNAADVVDQIPTTTEASAALNNHHVNTSTPPIEDFLSSFSPSLLSTDSSFLITSPLAASSSSHSLPQLAAETSESEQQTADASSTASSTPSSSASSQAQVLPTCSSPPLSASSSPSIMHSLADCSKSSISIWNRKTCSLIYANAAFRNSRFLTGPAIPGANYFDLHVLFSNVHVGAHSKVIIMSIVDPWGAGKEPSIRKFWQKSTEFYTSGEYYANFYTIRMDNDHFVIEGDAVFLGKLKDFNLVLNQQESSTPTYVLFEEGEDGGASVTTAASSHISNSYLQIVKPDERIKEKLGDLTNEYQVDDEPVQRKRATITLSHVQQDSLQVIAYLEVYKRKMRQQSADLTWQYT